MSNTAAQLNNLLAAKADYNFAVLQLALWSSRQEANASKLAAQQSAAEKWEGAYDSAYDCGHYGDRDISAGNVTIRAGKTKSEYSFTMYANAKVKNYNANALEEYSDLDTEYDLMVSTYEAMVTELGAMIESYEESVSAGAQDTGLLGG